MYYVNAYEMLEVLLDSIWKQLCFVFLLLLTFTCPPRSISQPNSLLWNVLMALSWALKSSSLCCLHLKIQFFTSNTMWASFILSTNTFKHFPFTVRYTEMWCLLLCWPFINGSSEIGQRSSKGTRRVGQEFA